MEKEGNRSNKYRERGPPGLKNNEQNKFKSLHLKKNKFKFLHFGRITFKYLQ